MKKRLKKSLVAIFSCLAVSCTGLATVDLTKVSADTYTAYASQVLTASDGLTVEYGVSGSEKVATLTKDTRKGIHFSANQSGDAAEGNSVTFNNTLSGLFEMDFRVYTQNKASINYGGGDWFNGNNAEEVREIAITLTDTDQNESFTLYVKGGSPWMESVPNARVAYGDVGANYGTGMRYGVSNGNDYDDTTTPYNGGSLSSKEYNTQIRGTSFTNWYLHSTVVGFDPITKEVYSYNFKSSASESEYASLLNRRVILDLDDVDHLSYAGTGASKLLNCKFNNYKVKFTLTDVTGASETGSQGKDEPANFIIYSLNGQSLSTSSGILTSSTAPGLAANVESSWLQYREYQIPTPVLQSVLGEKPAFTGKVKVLDESGNEVLANQTFKQGLAFTPQTAGTYKIVYSGVKDGVGNTRGAFTAKGTFVGSEITYTYPVVIEKSYKVTGSASDLLQVEGLEATYNVSGSQLHEDLVRDVSKGIAFTSTGLGADAVGSSVTFKNTLTGLMELNFRAYTESTDTAADYYLGDAWYTRNNAEEIREIAITVTDQETNERFTVYVQGGTAWNAVTPNARVAYGDVGENYGSGRWYQVNANGLAYYGSTKGLQSTGYNTELVGTSFTNRARNAGGFIGCGYSTNIGFDPVTKVVYAYTYGTGNCALEKRPILDLDDAEDMQYLTMNASGGKINAGLPDSFKNSTFKNYTVKMTVTDMTDGASAKFVVYDLNGQSLAGADGELMSSAGYGLFLPRGETKFVNLEDAFSVPYASSVLTGEKPFNGTIEVVDENGKVVVEKQPYSKEVKFKPAATGKYVAYYGGMTDENGFVRRQYGLGKYDGEEERFACEFYVKDTAVELPSYDFVMRKMGVEIGAKPLALGLTTYLTVKKDGAVYNGAENLQIGENYAYSFQDDGEYELIYTVKSAAGGSINYFTSVEVVSLTGSFRTAETVLLLGEESVWDASDFVVYYCDEGEISDFLVYAEIYDGSSWVAVVTSPCESVNLKNMLLEFGEGDWRIAFEVSKNGDTLRLEKTFSVRDTVAPVIEVGALGEGFVSVPESDTQTVKHFVVLNGTKAVLPSATAIDGVDGATAVTVLLKKPTDTAAKPVSANTEITYLNGDYVIVYKAVDDAGNESSIYYLISVKSLWLTVTAKVDSVEFGSKVSLPKPEAVNAFTGEKITDFEWSAKLYFNGEELEKTDGEYMPKYVGEYTLVYTVAYANATQDWTTVLRVEDTQLPVVRVDGTYESTATLGQKITLLEATVEDESPCSLSVIVIYNGTTKIAVNGDNQFTVDKAGEYLIRYSATDVSGNTSSVEFTVTVKDPNASKFFGCSGSVNDALAVSSLLLILSCATLLKKKKEN